MFIASKSLCQLVYHFCFAVQISTTISPLVVFRGDYIGRRMLRFELAGLPLWLLLSVSLPFSCSVVAAGLSRRENLLLPYLLTAAPATSNTCQREPQSSNWLLTASLRSHRTRSTLAVAVPCWSTLTLVFIKKAAKQCCQKNKWLSMCNEQDKPQHYPMSSMQWNNPLCVSLKKSNTLTAKETLSICTV